jgi:hypothetical protein
MINQFIYRSIPEENIPWDNVVDNLHDEYLLSIERYDQMEKRFDDAKFFMRCILFKKKKTVKHSSTMCSINHWQSENSTQTIIEKNERIDYQSDLIDDIISEFIII